MLVKFFIAHLIIVSAASAGGFAQNMSGIAKPSLKVRHIESDFAVSDLSGKFWKKADPVSVTQYWSGAKAPQGRHFTARLLWSKTALYVRFEANQSEPLVVAADPKRTEKTMNLWDRDVCEIFVAPDRGESRKYFEFEIAPTGEWLDVALDLTSGTRVSNWKYSSAMESTARVEKDKIVLAIKIPWAALGKAPAIGDVWLGNLLRCVGTDSGRGYLAWQPTLTSEPAFHVPEKFGEFKFVE